LCLPCRVAEAKYMEDHRKQISKMA
jgi:hypothetical protein